MPTKNAIKEYAPEAYYHVYTRGVNKSQVFFDDEDKTYFLSLLKRYLSKKTAISKDRFVYKNYANEVELLCYCLMGNHIHLMLYQVESDSMARFMRSLMTSYSMYFNKKYERVGPVFQSRYLACRIDSDAYLHHISRYIHLNPRNWESYEYSSVPYYLGQRRADWLKVGRVLGLFDDSTTRYRAFLQDYVQHRDMLDELQYELADAYITD